MPDKDSVIDGLDEISHYDSEQMFYNDVFIRRIAGEALDLLKEQETIIEQYRKANEFLAVHQRWMWEER